MRILFIICFLSVPFPLSSLVESLALVSVRSDVPSSWSASRSSLFRRLFLLLSFTLSKVWLKVDSSSYLDFLRFSREESYYLRLWSFLYSLTVSFTIDLKYLLFRNTMSRLIPSTIVSGEVSLIWVFTTFDFLSTYRKSDSFGDFLSRELWSDGMWSFLAKGDKSALF